MFLPPSPTPERRHKVNRAASYLLYLTSYLLYLGYTQKPNDKTQHSHRRGVSEQLVCRYWACHGRRSPNPHCSVKLSVARRPPTTPSPRQAFLPQPSSCIAPALSDYGKQQGNREKARKHTQKFSTGRERDDDDRGCHNENRYFWLGFRWKGCSWERLRFRHLF